MFKKKLKKQSIAVLSSLVAVSLVTQSVNAEEEYEVPSITVPGYSQEQLDAAVHKYLQEESQRRGGAPVGLVPGELHQILQDPNNPITGSTTQGNLTTVTAAPKTTTAPLATGIVAPPAVTSAAPVAPVVTTDDKDDNLDHDVYLDEEIGKDIHSVKFVTVNKSTGKKKVHDFKNEENDSDKDKVDYSKEPARVGFTPGASYAIVELEDGVYGQLVADRKTGKKLITAKYNLLKETIEKGSWEYKDEEVVEVKKEEKSEETTTTKSN